MMNKTIKDLFELYRSKSQGGKDFEDKHVVAKKKDDNGNGDEVFNASNMKSVDRKRNNLGYNPGEDEAVYEAKKVRSIDPAKLPVGKLNDIVSAGDQCSKTKAGNHRFYRGFFYRLGSSSEKHAKDVSDNLTALGVKHDVVDHGTQDYKPFKGGAPTKSGNHHWVDVKIHPGQTLDPKHHELFEDFELSDDEIVESVLKLVENEDFSDEQIDDLIEELIQENNTNKVQSSIAKYGRSAITDPRMAGTSYIQGHPESKGSKRKLKNAANTWDLVKKEETELDEGNAENKLKKNVFTTKLGGRVFPDKQTKTNISKDFYSDLVADQQGSSKEYAQKVIASQWKKTGRRMLKVESIRDKFIDKHVTPASIDPEERIVEAVMDYLNEQQITLLLDLYEQLDETNKRIMLQQIQDQNSVNELIDFVITNRGE